MDDNLNLNQNLFPNNSPYLQSQGITSGYAFDYENESGIISSSKIRNASIGNAQLGTAIIGTAQVGTLTFNQISGGTARLGGTANGNGVLNIESSGGSTQVIADSGSVIMYDDAGKEQFRLVYADQLLRINALDVGGTSPTQSGQIRMYDSGSILFAQFDVTEFFINKRVTLGSVTNPKPLEIAGSATSNPVGTPDANRCRIYLDFSGGKNRVMAQFSSGTPVVIATQP